MTAPFLEFRAAATILRPTRFYAVWGKRMLDLGIVLASLPVVVPVIGLLALVVMLDGGNPFFIHRRVGRNGRTFGCVKLRTMRRDAEAAMAAVLAADPALAAEWQRYQKLRHDPRVTRLGRLLRRASLDELPQVWNVLRGDMSLVGPRPFTPAQAGIYMGGRTDVAYYALRPGITGLWQVGSRNRAHFGERALADRDYAEILSFRGDLRILARTVGVVVRCTGV